MIHFIILLADVPIAVNALFPSTKTFCQEYLTLQPPAFSVTVTQEDLLSERIRNARQMAQEGYKQTDFSDEYIETLALYRKIAERLLEHQTLLFHGCVIAHAGKAYVFTAKSGTGKTTHANLWLTHIPDCHILNGDKPLLLFRDNTVYACGTPWMGKENLGRNEILPLGGICLLERSGENHIAPIGFSEAFSALVSQTHCPNGNKMMAVMKLLRLLQNVPIYRLGCNPNPDAAEIAYREMVLRKGYADKKL